MANRVTQEAIETLHSGISPNARVTQEAVEGLRSGISPNIRISQVVLEILVDVNPPSLVANSPLSY